MENAKSSPDLARPTHGPWRQDVECDDWSTDERLVVSDIEIDGEGVCQQIASVYEFDGQNPNAPRSRTAEANSRLIAASPELLAALERLCAEGCGRDVTPEAWDQALAAIVKATGVSP